MKLFNTLIAGGLLTISFLVITGATKAHIFQEKVAENAVKEWRNFHNPPIVVRAKADTEIRRDTGTAERPLEYAQCNIVNRYWRSVKTPPRGDFCRLPRIADKNQGGWDNYPWSAAFISFIMKQSGAGDQFKYSVRHATYILDAVKNRDNPNASFRGYHIDWIRPSVGDLICAPRGENAGLTYWKIIDQGDFESHCDIVVAKNNNQLEVIGGNVGDSVAKTIVSLDDQGHIKVTKPDFRPWFVVIKNNLR
ncbi:DUF2272 domain-containing protein [Microcystis sp. LEGE 00066]|uniref:DUF2272 domain-containing protein n=2 Tax=Microcystis aeruginosa (strain PCC 7806) TaxID=267872 RepID=A8YBR4_MICA7|nr:MULTISPECIES: DUF2272 domain-containing protein [Microcystis]TRT95942.1 MAG: DUF2272 domain-containing protein [Microcystis aeruginosa Ma_AC_P_19900807_S300]ARI80955.1 hypothetical protein BH695_1674 [Microcystis aeruginosa PCC 7806SL]ELS49799.1 hypothetical protein C789_428 [Microcystis aeruginosa FACHB-905 = DIANCHI905]MBE9263159.1 DUF2272 domain-containing protein [Microcystis sp. LEGE 00066]UGS07649.1 DUF2272 domain-containing protein [Microcystis aeruginosa FACHB-905 = DIANCHI905]